MPSGSPTASSSAARSPKAGSSRSTSRRRRAVPGVLDVLTHAHRPRMAHLGVLYKDMVAPGGTPFRPLYDEHIVYAGQPIALVVAETFEAARHAAQLVRAALRRRGARHRPRRQAAAARATRAGSSSATSRRPSPRGDPEGAWQAAPFKMAAEYFESSRVPQPDGAVRDHGALGRRRPADDPRQDPGLAEQPLLDLQRAELKRKNVRVLNEFVGGAFGSGLRPQHQLLLATMAALQLERSVRVVLTARPDVQLRPPARVRADAAPRLRRRRQAGLDQPRGGGRDVAARGLRRGHGQLGGPALSRTEHAPRLSGGAASTAPRRWTCAPRARPAACAPSSARWTSSPTRSGIDPVALRLANYTERDESADRPFSSKALRECFAEGAERFGWSRRTPEPRLDARRAPARRLGHGHRRLGRDAGARARPRRARRRRLARRQQRHQRHRHRHRHGDEPDRRRDARPAAGEGRLPPRRLRPADGAGAGRLVHGGERRHRGAGGLPQGRQAPARPGAEGRRFAAEARGVRRRGVRRRLRSA